MLKFLVEQLKTRSVEFGVGDYLVAVELLLLFGHIGVLGGLVNIDRVRVFKFALALLALFTLPQPFLERFTGKFANFCMHIFQYFFEVMPLLEEFLHGQSLAPPALDISKPFLIDFLAVVALLGVKIFFSSLLKTNVLGLFSRG